MAVIFYLRRMRRKKNKESDENLPKIEGCFAFTEYPRFLRRLADDSGLGSLWEEYGEASSCYSKKVLELVRAGGRSMVETDQNAKILHYKMLRARRAIERKMHEEPLVELLLARSDEHQFTSKSCARIGPRLRAVAERWEPAPEGWNGWRERAVEMADAMAFAAEHPDVVFNISG